MEIAIRQEPAATLGEYGSVPIAFEIRSTFDLSAPSRDSSAFVLTERVLATPVLKDYDAVAGEGPERWRTRFDLTNWGIFGAHSGGKRVGGTVVAFRSPGVNMLEGRDDLAVLWDIRVAPEARGRGVGTALVRAAESWASANGATSMKIETQNINVPACRFYERRGYVLRAANPGAYSIFPDEIQLLWYKDLRENTNTPNA